MELRQKAKKNFKFLCDSVKVEEDEEDIKPIILNKAPPKAEKNLPVEVLKRKEPEVVNIQTKKAKTEEIKIRTDENIKIFPKSLSTQLCAYKRLDTHQIDTNVAIEKYNELYPLYNSLYDIFHLWSHTQLIQNQNRDVLQY